MLAGAEPGGADRPDRGRHPADPRRQRRRDAPALQPAEGRRDVHAAGRRFTRAASTSAIGRAPGTDPLTTFALQRDRRQAAPDDFPQQLAELLAYLEDDLPDDHPFPRLAAHPPRAPDAPRAVAARLLAAERDLGRRARAAVCVRRLHQSRRRRDRGAVPRAVRHRRRLPPPGSRSPLGPVRSDRRGGPASGDQQPHGR